jgi:dUTP pyrophosphatase
MLKVKLLDPAATLPTVAHVGEDLGYDLYAFEDSWVFKTPSLIRTGIAVAAYSDPFGYQPVGLIIKDRSSMASKGVFTHAGVIDAGYRGEIWVNMTYDHPSPYNILAGDKIAQMVPAPVLTGNVIEVEDLGATDRGASGFGSSGATGAVRSGATGAVRSGATVN